ncbi:cytochrome c oxidase assembly protein [Streptomyces zhihengii]
MLDISGLWVLHPTGLLVAGHANALFLGAVQVHMVAAGLLFACMVCRLDPVGRPWGPAWRGGTTGRRGGPRRPGQVLYTAPPPGTAFTGADLHTSAQLMHYGGDLVALGLATVLAAQWYAATGRAAARTRRRAARQDADAFPRRKTGSANSPASP